jgi:hypothetical protein
MTGTTYKKPFPNWTLAANAVGGPKRRLLVHASCDRSVSKEVKMYIEAYVFDFYEEKKRRIASAQPHTSRTVSTTL